MGLRVPGIMLILFAVTDLILHSWKIHDLWAGSPAEGMSFAPAILVGAAGIWLLRCSRRPRGRWTIPLLIASGCILFSLCLQVVRSRHQSLDQVIVMKGTYEDICPGRTISELLAPGHEKVVWDSYLNIYGHPSVKAVCYDDRSTVSAMLVWTVDDNDRFWIQYAEQDGTPIDPYRLLDRLCRNLSGDSVTPASP